MKGNTYFAKSVSSFTSIHASKMKYLGTTPSNTQIRRDRSKQVCKLNCVINNEKKNCEQDILAFSLLLQEFS